jgi:hypothetical protein
VVEGLDRDGEPLADDADTAGVGDAHLVKVELARRAALDAQLAVGHAEREALVALLHHARRDAATGAPSGSVSVMTV